MARTSPRAAHVLVVALLAVLAAAPAARSQGFETGIFDPAAFSGAPASAFERVRTAGATSARVLVPWESIAPAAPATGFDPRNPADAGYSWASLDAEVSAAVAAGLRPILCIITAPRWATVPAAAGHEATLPEPTELGKFALAVSRRYAGGFAGLPRVRHWQVWNEPNISLFFRPQLLDGQPFSPAWYREMVNQVAASVKSVHADNLVVAGGTAPFHDNTPEVMAVDPNWGPLSFLRAMLCLSETLVPTCSARARFDVWAHHPYTSGGPGRRAVRPHDVSLGDMPELRAVLAAAEQAGHVQSDGPVRLWVTEFSWDSNPPDPNGVPDRLLSRWTAEAMYRMWQSGVSLVTWFLLRDMPSADVYQSGLWTRGTDLSSDAPKPLLDAFRFPFVGFAHRDRIAVWGRTPGGRAATVRVQQSFAGGWQDVASRATDQHGIFEATFLSPSSGSVRAVTDRGEQAVPFDLRPVRDEVFHPFGLGPLEQIAPPVRPPLPPRGTHDSSRRAIFQGGLR